MDKYLPVGTVVLLKNGKKPVSIIGYKIFSKDNNYIMKSTEFSSNKVFDYCAVLYPEGLINNENFILFDHDSIDKVVYMGYESDESKKLSQFLSNN